MLRRTPHLLGYKQDRLKRNVGGVPSNVDGFVNSFR
jgi:hypothetical protein